MKFCSCLYKKCSSCCLPKQDNKTAQSQSQSQSQSQTHQMAGSSQMSNHSREEKSVSTLSSELNLGSFAVSSGVLDQSWDAISKTKVHFKDQLSGSDLTIELEVKELPKYNIIVFVTPPVTRSDLLEKTELVTSSKESTISGFDFLQPSRKNLSFSINKAALFLFDSCKRKHSDRLGQIAEAAKSKPYIITGDGIGGSVASLFALQLLNSLDTTKAKPPLCITFGSPLLGDRGLQGAIKDNTWDSCFLHVVSMDDCFPTLFAQHDHPAGGQTTGDTIAYHPFGRFMFCSNPGGACFEDPESALILLRKIGAESGRNEQSFDYGSIIANLRKGLICKDQSNLNANGIGSSRVKASVAAQYLAALLQLQNVEGSSQLKELVENEVFAINQKKEALEREAKELNEIKEFMVYMERYKKISEDNKIPYYDNYKNQADKATIKVIGYKKILQNYWECKVKVAEQKPQKAKAALRVRWLFGGTTYRRIFEPLAIADYYEGEHKTDYINQGRLKHYKLLEEWYKEDTNKTEKPQNDVPPSLTEDSCFWAHVEEAIIISCEILKKGESASSEVEKLKDFERYVLELIRKYKVSSEIFLEKSRFMKWWKDYEKILDKKLMGTSYTSLLFEIMHNCKYKLYESGKLCC